MVGKKIPTKALIQSALQEKASPEKREASMWFFKTGKGAYGAHEQFIGVTVPEQRKIAREFQDASFQVIRQLLKSKIHEHRLTALIIMTLQYKKGDEAERKAIYTLYLASTAHVNNWDLVDVSAPYIAGEYLYEYADWKKVLPKLAKSKNLWEKRIAIVATQAFSRHGVPGPCLAVAPLLLTDTHDLIHKAVGWMLREMGKYCGREKLETFLLVHYATMPRTALRYAIEHFPEKQRKAYLAGTVK